MRFGIRASARRAGNQLCASAVRSGQRGNLTRGIRSHDCRASPEDCCRTPLASAGDGGWCGGNRRGAVDAGYSSESCRIAPRARPRVGVDGRGVRRFGAGDVRLEGCTARPRRRQSVLQPQRKYSDVGLAHEPGLPHSGSEPRGHGAHDLRSVFRRKIRRALGTHGRG